MKTEINIIGIKQVIQNINNLKNNLNKILPVKIKETALFMQNEVKLSIAGHKDEPTSVDTGRFLNSIDIEALNKESAKVFTDLEYAKFLEFGTSKISPRKHFQNSVFRNKEMIKKDFNVAIKQLI